MQAQLLKFDKNIDLDSSSFIICDFCSMFHTSSLIFLVLDMSFSIVMFNDRFLNILDIEDKEKLIGKNFLDFIPEKQRLRMGNVPKKLLTNENNIYKEIVLELKTKKYEPCAIKWFNSITVCHGIDFLCMIGMLLTEENENENKFPKTQNEFRIHWANVITKHKALIKSIKDGEIFNG